jgi:3-oxoacyl-[acyl-carrier protein] reductase
MKLAGRVALVTGGGRGIGRCTALALAREGAAVGVTARSADQLDQTVNLIREAGGTALAVPADVSHRDEVNAAVRQVAETLGPIDILVNNAGVARFASVLDSTEEDWRTMFEVNALGALFCVQAVLPSMIERRQGWIISVSSTTGIKGYPEQSAYCASKHALMALAKVLALETQEHGIRVHAICPATTDTDMVRGVRTIDGPSEWIKPEEIAETVVFLASFDGNAMIDNVVVRRYPTTPWS